MISTLHKLSRRAEVPPRGAAVARVGQTAHARGQLRVDALPMASAAGATGVQTANILLQSPELVGRLLKLDQLPLSKVSWHAAIGRQAAQGQGQCVMSRLGADMKTEPQEAADRYIIPRSEAHVMAGLITA